MKTTNQPQNPQAILTPPIAVSPGASSSVPALIIPEDYRARAVAVQARERILRSPKLSALALDGAATFDRRSFIQPFSQSPLRPFLEEVVEEVITEVDGASPPGTFTSVPRGIPGILSRFMPWPSASFAAAVGSWTPRIRRPMSATSWVGASMPSFRP